MSARVYLSADAPTAHLLPWGVSPNSPVAALCGRDPWPSDWLGTGTQVERDRAAELPLCIICRNAVIAPKVISLPKQQRRAQGC
jgi:hypothetical protein